MPTRKLQREPWSLRIGAIAGIPIRVHLTFVLLIAYLALSYMMRGLAPSATLAGIALVLSVFAVVVIHELGHALMARRFGVGTREILLLPIGGIASLERIPEKPKHELAVAIVGPAINFAIAGILWLGLAASGSSTSLGGSFAAQLMWINIGLAIFNLIPAFPMDGGRALRAILAMRLGHARATDIAARLGTGIAVVFGVIGLLTNFWLILIAVVVWMGARHEAAAVRVRSALVSVPVSAAMNRHIDIVSPDESLGEAARLLVSTGQWQLPIVDHGETVGVLTKGDVAEGIRDAGDSASIAQAPHHEAITVGPNDSLEGVFDRLAHEPGAIAVVVDHGTPIGIVTAEQLTTFAALHAEHPSVNR